MRGDRPDEYEEAAAVQRVLDGEVEAFGMLVQRYRAAYGRFAVGLCGDPDLAADAMQEAFIRAYDRLATCEHPGRFGAWFYRILRNQCLNHRARQHRHLSLDDVQPTASGRTDDRVEQAELRTRLETAIRHLPDAQREAFVLRHVDGRSYADMAAMLGEREDRLRTRVLRARNAIRSALEGAHA